jgi:hypothetical protein
MFFLRSVKAAITGMNPKASFGNYFAASCVVLYPPLCGIVQLTNSAVLRARNWSFTIKAQSPKMIPSTSNVKYFVKRRRKKDI